MKTAALYIFFVLVGWGGGDRAKSIKWFIFVREGEGGGVRTEER